MDWIDWIFYALMFVLGCLVGFALFHLRHHDQQEPDDASEDEDPENLAYEALQSEVWFGD